MKQGCILRQPQMKRESGGTEIVTSLKYPEFFKISDENTDQTYYGCNQEWFTTRWRRLSGCGPSVCTNIIHYLGCVKAGGEYIPITKSDCVRLMDSVWEHVTPTLRGIPNTEILYDGMISYARENGLDLQLNVFNVPKHSGQRTDMKKLITFLNESLSNNAPVAFLNLDNGAEEGLDSWHWVTLIRLESGEDGSAFADILDEGLIKKVDIALWYRTTKQSGGFVSIGWR